MKNLKADIQNNTLKRFYLLYGEDAFLLTMYKNKLVKAFFSEPDEFNMSSFSGKKIDFPEVKSVSETLPFFAERRLIVFNKCDLFSKTSELADYIDKAPETTYYIFIEEKVDKRNKLFKYISNNGYVCEIKVQSRDELITLVGKTLASRGFNITAKDCEYFIDKVGISYARIQTELEKLCGYCMGETVVTRESIDAICYEVPENKIFVMLDSIMSGNAEQAVKLYYDMLLLHEKPNVILYMLTKTFNQLYQVLKLNSEGLSRSEIASKTGLRDFIVDKYIRYNRKFSVETLASIVDEGLTLEHQLKVGDLDKNMAVELFIVKYSHY